MKKAFLDFSPRWQRMSVRIVVALFTAFVFSGCTMIYTKVPELGPSYKPVNIYRQSDVLPAQVRRVAVLPLTTTTSTALLAAGAEGLTTILQAELEKSGRFELALVTAEQLREWTGQTSWRADEQLPLNFLDRLREGTGCDAVLFCQLIRYQPYEPLAIGWKFSLVEQGKAAQETNSPPKEVRLKIIWSADEVFDAGDIGVANAARSYYSEHLRNEAPVSDSSTILGSPSRFGQYTLNALFETLPGRPNK